MTKKRYMLNRSLFLTTVILAGSLPVLCAEEPLSEEQVDEYIERMTTTTYLASNKAQAKGDKVAPIEGIEIIKLRFIRLNHGGIGWNDGMGKSGADANFLRAFANATGFKAAKNGESHSIAMLASYPEDGFPPFVYLTGNDQIGPLSTKDLKTLREYCLKGGMLIADAGSAKFHESFLAVMRQVFPEKKLVDIADDDTLYKLPYELPKGAPAFWQHGGRRALGIRHEGRWCVFYHPGDMNDAWKSEGYADITPEMRDAAMNLGINLVYYSFNQWKDAVQKKRK